MARGFRVPWLSLGFVILALAASIPESCRKALIFERTAIGAGEWWRLWTAHLVHSWPALAAIDLGMVLVLGAWVERRSRRALALTIAISTTTASLAVLLWRTDLELYQGASTIACALFVLVGTRTLIEAESWFARGVAALALVLFAIKTCVELTHDAPWSVVPLPDGVQVVAIAHTAGGISGLGLGAVMRTAPSRVV